MLLPLLLNNLLGIYTPPVFVESNEPKLYHRQAVDDGILMGRNVVSEGVLMGRTPIDKGQLMTQFP